MAMKRLRADNANLLPEETWKNQVLPWRSKELTVLSVQRYNGPRLWTVSSVHNFWELICVRGGSGRLLGENRIALSASSIVLVPPGARHMEYTRERLDLIWVQMRGQALGARTGRDILSLSSPAISDLVEKLWMLSRTSGPVGQEFDGLVRVILGRFGRHYADRDSPSGRDLIERVVRYLHEEIAVVPRVDALARQFGCSMGYFERLFKKRMGRPLVAYLTALRVEHATHMLTHTDLPVGEIAAAVGYGDQFYFSRVFTREVGVNPSEYREIKRRSRPVSSRRRRSEKSI